MQFRPGDKGNSPLAGRSMATMGQALAARTVMSLPTWSLTVSVRMCGRHSKPQAS